MPVLSKFRFRTPLDDFENYLGEEMNTFSGFFADNFVEDQSKSSSEEIKTEEKREQVTQESHWKKRIKAIFRFVSINCIF